MGSLESWLLLRSLKTLHLRVPRQAETATALAKWLQSVSNAPKGQVFESIPGGIVTRVWHSSLQGTDARGFNPQNQMPGGFNPTFSIEVSGVISHGLSIAQIFIPLTSPSSRPLNWPHDSLIHSSISWSVAHKK